MGGCSNTKWGEGTVLSVILVGAVTLSWTLFFFFCWFNLLSIKWAVRESVVICIVEENSQRKLGFNFGCHLIRAVYLYGFKGKLANMERIGWR